MQAAGIVLGIIICLAVGIFVTFRKPQKTWTEKLREYADTPRGKRRAKLFL